MIVSAIEPTRLARTSHSRSAGPEPVPEIPDEVPHATEHVVNERPAVAEQHDSSDPARSRRLKCSVGVGARCGGRQPPRQQYRPDIERSAGDPMDDGHHHREHRPINLEMRRQRSRRGGFGLCHMSNHKNSRSLSSSRCNGQAQWRPWHNCGVGRHNDKQVRHLAFPSVPPYRNLLGEVGPHRQSRITAQ